jgi:hypothetical protein
VRKKIIGEALLDDVLMVSRGHELERKTQLSTKGAIAIDQELSKTTIDQA